MFPTEIKSIKEHAVNVVFKKDIDGMDDKTKDIFERMLSYMEQRCISIPMIAIKRLPANSTEDLVL